MRLHALTIVAALLANTALATGNGPGQGDGSCVGNCPDAGGGSSEARLEANLTALGFSKADARAMATAGANASNKTNVNATGGNATGGKSISAAQGGAGGNAVSAAQGGAGGRSMSDQTQSQTQAQTATGGSATQTQGSVTGAQSARTGDVAVTVDQSNRARIPVATALAPDLMINGGERCYWTFSVVGAAQSSTGGGSAGAGLFPFILDTCMKMELADRYAAGYGENPEALRLLREIEASLD